MKNSTSEVCSARSQWSISKPHTLWREVVRTRIRIIFLAILPRTLSSWQIPWISISLSRTTPNRKWSLSPFLRWIVIFLLFSRQLFTCRVYFLRSHIFVPFSSNSEYIPIFACTHEHDDNSRENVQNLKYSMLRHAYRALSHSQIRENVYDSTGNSMRVLRLNVFQHSRICFHSISVVWMLSFFFSFVFQLHSSLPNPFRCSLLPTWITSTKDAQKRLQDLFRTWIAISHANKDAIIHMSKKPSKLYHSFGRYEYDGMVGVFFRRNYFIAILIPNHLSIELDMDERLAFVCIFCHRSRAHTKSDMNFLCRPTPPSFSLTLWSFIFSVQLRAQLHFVYIFCFVCAHRYHIIFTVVSSHQR